MIEIENRINQICQKLTYCQLIIENKTTLECYDINKIAENFIANILNFLFDWKLTNINNDKKNFPSIDLHDINRKISVQVSSNNSNNKIQDTINKFIENKLFEKYNYLYFFLLKNKLKKYNIKEKQNSIDFFKVDYILDFQTIFTQIKKSELDLLIKLDDYLTETLPNFTRQNNITEQQSIKVYRDFLDRPAMQLRFTNAQNSNSLERYNKAIRDITKLLNTGKCKGFETLNRNQFLDNKLKDKINFIYENILNIRTILGDKPNNEILHKEINQIEHYQRNIIYAMNRLCDEFNYESIKICF